MNNKDKKPLVVTREAVDAYEKKTGFYGIGQRGQRPSYRCRGDFNTGDREPQP